MIALPLLFGSSASADTYWFALYDFKAARADASLDYLTVSTAGSGDAGGRIAVLVVGKGSYYVKYRAAERGPLKWHRGTNNVKKSSGRREFGWSDNFFFTTWAYEFKICQARKYRKDPCGNPMTLSAAYGSA